MSFRKHGIIDTGVANLVLATPSSATGVPLFRSLAPADLVIGSGGGTSNFLRADGTWAPVVASVSTTDDNSTNTIYYPVFATAAGGATLETGSSFLKYKPSTGALTANSFVRASGTSSEILKGDGSVLTQTNAGTQFLRDDGTWQTVSGGGGGTSTGSSLYLFNYYGGL